MSRAPRTFAFVALAGLALVATGCGSNKDKLIGKWKMVSMTPKDGKEQKVEFMGITPIMEFTADGNILVGADMSGMAPELKEKMNSPEANQMKQMGKYKVSGSKIEFLDMEKGGNAPAGKFNGGTLKFDGDTVTITGDDGSFKLSRMK